jgi:sugar lactone lactonase YvrE
MKVFSAECIPNTKGDLGEGLLWDERNQTIMWVDAFVKIINTWDPATKTLIERKYDSLVTSIAKRESGGYVVAAGLKLIVLNENLDVISSSPLEMPNENVRTNDGNVDLNGNYWVGSFANDAKPKQGNLRRISPNLESKVFLQDITIANGMDWSLDNKICYYIDTPTKKVSRFNFNTETSEFEGELEAIDVSQYSGAPDGMCVDAAGNLWVAFWGGGCVRSFSPTGELLAQVDVAATLVTNCAFGGPDLSTLYITCAIPSYEDFVKGEEPLAGSLFKADVGAKGRLQNNFLG